jgi:hypothetical protein
MKDHAFEQYRERHFQQEQVRHVLKAHFLEQERIT